MAIVEIPTCHSYTWLVSWDIQDYPGGDMAWIRIVEESEAGDALRKVY